MKIEEELHAEECMLHVRPFNHTFKNLFCRKSNSVHKYMSVVTTCHGNIKRKTSSLGFSLSVKMKSKRSLLNLSLHLGKPTNIKSVKIIISREEYKLCITLISADFTN